MSASCSDNDMVLKQKVIDLVGKYKAEDIVEHETTHLPGGYVTVTIKFKKKTCGVILSEEDKREFREKREKASNSGKGKDDKSLSLDKGKGKRLVLTAEFLEGYLKMRQEGDKSEGKDDKVKMLEGDKSEGKGLGKGKGSGEVEFYNISTPTEYKSQLFVLVGIPGSGKSSCLSKAMDNYPNSDYCTTPIKHVNFQGLGSRPFIHLGSLRADYPGTDSLPRAHKVMVDFLKDIHMGMNMGMEQIIVAEGHRVTSANLIGALSNHYDIFIIHLVCDKNIAADRVLSRGGREPYSELFVAKMASAINNVKKASPAGRFLTVDATDDIDTVASAVKNLIRERITR